MLESQPRKLTELQRSVWLTPTPLHCTRSYTAHVVLGGNTEFSGTRYTQKRVEGRARSSRLPRCRKSVSGSSESRNGWIVLLLGVQGFMLLELWYVKTISCWGLDGELPLKLSREIGRQSLVLVCFPVSLFNMALRRTTIWRFTILTSFGYTSSPSHSS